MTSNLNNNWENLWQVDRSKIEEMYFILDKKSTFGKVTLMSCISDESASKTFSNVFS